MRKALPAALFAALILGGCVHSRWPAKVLGDGTVISSKPVDATLTQLRAMPRPDGVDGFNAPRVPQERQVYRVRALLLRFALASDGDVHLAIAEPRDPGVTMVAEIPDPDRMNGALPRYRAEVARTRRDFIAAFGTPVRGTWHQIRRQVVLSGPIFFDFVDQVGGETGVAPNGIEIHPVLSITPAGKTKDSLHPKK